MRRVQHYRNLALQETQIARSVFKSTIPYPLVLVSDALGGGDRPFTVPTYLPLSPYFNVKGGLYVIHAGDGYYGMSSRPDDRRLLIHELTHVWQAVHQSRNYMASSIWNQVLTADAYAYDKGNLKNWEDYGAEQQAQIVEDWYADGMKTDRVKDTRFYYIKKYIWGEAVDSDWIKQQICAIPQ